ncbi:hypothetical protein ACUOA8_61635, partial [Escherichia sp. SS-MK2]
AEDEEHYGQHHHDVCECKDLRAFLFNHSPIISSFAVAKREEYGDMAEQKCSKILAFAHIMMVLTVMFFVFS